MSTDDVLLDFEEEALSAPVATKKTTGGHAGSHSAGFKDFLLKPEILRAIQECGFERPSDVQQECIPQAVLGQDVLCQAKPGMGKTAVFVIATLQQLKPVDGEVSVLVMCHTRELAYQIHKEYVRFAKFFEPAVRAACFYGGTPITNDQKVLKDATPHVVIGTPGRIAALVKDGNLKLAKIKHFVLDECDKVLSADDMRGTVQEVFVKLPYGKQVMMFSATLPKEIRPTCKKFMTNPMEVFVDDDTELVLRQLQQHSIKLEEREKNKRLFALLDSLEFNQVIIFVKSVQRCIALEELLGEQNFPVTSIHGSKKQDARLASYNAFKNFEKRILVATDVFGRGMDIERVNIVINYDMPEERERERERAAEGAAGEEQLGTCSDTYLHRVARAGRFGTHGLAISFVASERDEKLLQSVRERFGIEVPPLPDSLDSGSYYTKKD